MSFNPQQSQEANSHPGSQMRYRIYPTEKFQNVVIVSCGAVSSLMHKGTPIQFAANVLREYDKVDESHLEACCYLNFAKSSIRCLKSEFLAQLLCLNISETNLELLDSVPLTKLVQLTARGCKFKNLDTKGFIALEILDVSLSRLEVLETIHLKRLLQLSASKSRLRRCDTTHL